MFSSEEEKAKYYEELRAWHKKWEAQPSYGQLRKEAQDRLKAKIAARKGK